MRFSLFNKLSLGFSVLLSLMLIMGIVSYTQLVKVHNSEEETISLKEKSTHFSSLTTKLNGLILLSDFVMENNEGIHDYYMTEAMMISQEFENTKEANLTEKELALISQSELCFERIDFAISKYIMLVDDDQAKSEEANKIYEESTNLIRIIDFIEEHIDTELKQAIDNSTNAMKLGKTVILSLSILATLLGIAISIIITVMITRPLKKVKTATESIALGNLDYHLEISSNDEIGDLAKSFNGMVLDLKTTRNLLVKEKKSTENIIKSMHDILIVLNEEGKIKKINAAGCKLLQYSSKNLLDQYIDILLKNKNFHEVDFPNIISEGFVEEMNRTFIAKDGTEIPINLSASVMYNANEDIEGIVCVAQDITERQRYEQELASVAKFPEEDSNAVIRISKIGVIIYSNDAGLTILDYWKRKVGGELPEVYRTPIMKSLESANKKELEIVHNGRTYELIITPIPDFGYVNIYGNDVTHKKRAERELIKAMEIVEHSKQIKEQFLANMSHEIRTPMNGIIGMTKLMIDTKMNDEQLEYMESIEQSGNNLLVIINDILDISKIEAGKMTFEKTEFNLPHLMQNLISTMQFKAKEKSNILSYSTDNDVPKVLIGDPVRLNQIFINLVGNALKFTDSGKVKIKVSTVENDENQCELKFSISDTGIGIPKEKIDTIFDSFDQAALDTTRKYGGTGLGLTITKQLIDLQNGELYVESEVNIGTTFFFTLPFEIGDNKELKSKSSKQFKPVLFENIDVLLVEDNPINQLLAKKVLSKWKCNIEVAANGKIAIDKLNNKDYAIILMDVQMPEMDGHEATKYIRSNMNSGKENVPILAMTAHVGPQEAKRCIESGMNDCITKPFDPKDLNVKMNMYINQKK